MLRRLIAHRGWPAKFPENSLAGIAAALQAGAMQVEFDVQLSADGVPVVIHDADLRRTADLTGQVGELAAAQLRRVSVHEPTRFGERFKDTLLPSLEDVVSLLAEFPEVTAFVEIKRASLRQFGVDATVDTALAHLQPVGNRAVIISFDERALRRVREQGAGRIGWILETWSPGEEDILNDLQPEFVFFDFQKLPAIPGLFPGGPWQWVVYEIARAQTAREWLQRGAQYVETMDVGALINEFKEQAGAAD